MTSLSVSLIGNLISAVGSSQQRIVQPQALSFNFAYNGGFDNYNTTTLPSILVNPNFDPSKTTIFYFIGLLQLISSARPVMIRDAYIASGKYNVVFLDFKNISDYTFYKLESIGNHTAKAIIGLLDAGLSRTNNYELAGFSLGGQLCGYVGRGVKIFSKNKYIVPKIFALDAAINLLIIKDLSKTDAAFVMTMHTSFDLGNVFISGHVDFFVNYGMQPRCNATVMASEIDCNHQTVQFYWAEAIVEGATSFMSDPRCIFFFCKTSYMNPWTPKTPTGPFSVRVNADSPYSLN